MHKSSVIQHFLQQRTLESLIEGIVENLEVRFQFRNLQAVRSMLGRSETLQHIKHLCRVSIQTPNLNAFLQTLELDRNTNGIESLSKHVAQ